MHPGSSLTISLKSLARTWLRSHGAAACRRASLPERPPQSRGGAPQRRSALHRARRLPPSRGGYQVEPGAAPGCLSPYSGCSVVSMSSCHSARDAGRM